MSDRLSRILNHEISNVNNHLPKRPITLKSLLRLDNKALPTRTGDKYVFDDKEVSQIASMLDEEDFSEVELPIFLTRRRDLGTGAFYVGGSRGNVYLVQRILGNVTTKYSTWKLIADVEKLRLIYRPEYAIVRKMLKTCTVPAFS